LELPKISIEKLSIKALPPYVKTLLLIVPITIVFLLLNFLFLTPKSKQLKKAKEETNKLQAEINKNKQQLASFKPLSEPERKEIAETEETLQLMLKSLGTVREVYDKITNRAVSCGINDLSIDPSYRPPLQAGEIIDIENQLGLEQHRTFIKLKFHSELKSLGCLLDNLLGGEDFLIIESLSIKRELPRPAIELVLKLFTKS
jgi:hypothetical protein